MKFNFKHKKVLPKAADVDNEEDSTKEGKARGRRAKLRVKSNATVPPSRRRAEKGKKPSRRLDIIPKDVDTRRPPINLSNMLVKNYRDFDSKSATRTKGPCFITSPLVNELRRYKTPEMPDEEIIRLIRSGDRTGNFLLFLKHYKYILKKINDITQGAWYSDDILQAGAVGLYEAALRFDETRKVKFLTYAHSWILKMVYMEIRNDLLPMGGMGIGRDMKERLFNYIKYSMLGMTDEEIMSKLRINQKTLVELQILNRAVARIKSLNKSPDADEDDLEPYNEKGVPTKPSAESEYFTQEFFIYLENCIKTLAETDEGLAEFLNLELGLNGFHQMEKAEICDRLDLTSKEYEQLKKTGNRYLRTQMIEDGWYDYNSSTLGEAVNKCASELEDPQLLSI